MFGFLFFIICYCLTSKEATSGLLGTGYGDCSGVGRGGGGGGGRVSVPALRPVKTEETVNSVNCLQMFDYQSCKSIININLQDMDYHSCRSVT